MYYLRLPRLFADTHSGFIPYFRNKFPGLSQALESFFPEPIMQRWIFPSDRSSMSLEKSLLLEFSDFQDFPGLPNISRTFQSWKCSTKIQVLSRISRTRIPRTLSFHTSEWNCAVKPLSNNNTTRCSDQAGTKTSRLAIVSIHKGHLH